MNELILVLKKLMDNATLGPDQIHNLMLKYFPESSLKGVIYFFNPSLEQGRTLVIWKTANITMIPKKSSQFRDSSNYKPISMTSCLGKMLDNIFF